MQKENLSQNSEGENDEENHSKMSLEIEAQKAENLEEELQDNES